jgi:hypothetical protein
MATLKENNMQHTPTLDGSTGDATLPNEARRSQRVTPARHDDAPDEDSQSRFAETYSRMSYDELTRVVLERSQLGIFFGGAILTALLAEYVLDLSNAAVSILTKMLLYLAAAAIALSWAFGGRWLTIKRTCMAAVVLYGGVLIWFLLTVSGRQNIQR